MKNCHVCNFECEDNAELCPICGADLTNQPQEDVSEEIQIEPVFLATIEDVVSAEIFKDILMENKIVFSSSNESDTSMKVVFGGGFAAEEIFVDKKDFEKAQALYNEFLESEPEFDGEFSEEFEEEQ